jgi:Tol biopolymer transport system component
MSPLKRFACATAATLIAGIALANCGDLGPDEGELGHLAIQPVFAAGAAAVDVTAIRARLSRPGQPGFAADTTIPLQSDSGTVEIPLSIRLTTSPEDFLLEVLIIGTEGDTVFRGGPTPVTVRSGSDEPAVAEVDIEYVGVGSDAAFMFIEGESLDVPAGGELILDAMVFDSMENLIEGVPVLWSSLDQTRADVPDRETGRLVAGDIIGPVQIVARTLTGQADTATVSVLPDRPPQSVRWINAAGGEWTTGANWDIGTPPAPFDTAVIDLTGSYTITLGSLVSVEALQLGTANRQFTQELRLQAPFFATGDITLNMSGKLTLNVNSTVGVGGQILLGGSIVHATEIAPIVGNVQGAGGVVDIATGTLVIQGDFIMTPSDLIRGSGDLNLLTAGTVQLAGTIAPGTSPGILSIAGNPSFQTSTRLAIELDGTNVAQVDRLDIDGSVTIGGTLDVLFPGTFVPTPGDVFTIMTYGDATGQFSALNGTDLGNGLQLVPEYDLTELRLVAAGPQPVFTVQPTDVLPGQSITPVIEIEFQDPVTGSTIDFPNEITIALENNPTSANLLGQTQTFADGSTAFFGSSRVDRLGTGYTLRVTAAGASSEVSAPFNAIAGIVFAGTDGNFQAVSSLHPTGSNLETVSSLQTGFGFDAAPRWSPNRLRVVHTFSDPTGGATQVRVASSGGDSVATLVNDIDGHTPIWNRTGAHVAFHCGDGFSADQDVCTVQNIGTVPITSLNGVGNGAGRTVVTDGPLVNLTGPGAFAWDPSNPNQLVVARTITGASRPVSQLFVIGADGSNPATLGSPLTNTAGDTLNVEDITWAPDGSFLVFSAQNELTFLRRIYRIDRDGSNLQLLTGNPTASYDEDNPVISPDGSTVIYLQNRFDFEASDWNYFAVSATGGTPQQLSDETAFFISRDELGVDFSPDGSQIVFVGIDNSQAAPQPAIFVAPVSMRQATYFTDRTMISPTARMDVQPNWRP